ncbi:MAG: glycosyltransferase family 4 protein [Gemmatimonadota bacterium]|nr:MAG: glycosyltransferase family 4 protein [Gemmatimonadota bacterium]
MKVGFNARLLQSPRLRGWNRYTVNLLMALGDLEVELVLYSDQPLSDEHLRRLDPATYRVRTSPPMRNLRFEQVWLPRACREDAVDVLHSPFNFGLPGWRPCPTVLTLHDAIPQAYHHRSGLRTSLYHKVARSRASHIITPSQHSKGDLMRLLGISAERISVIPEAADPRFNAPVPAEDRRRTRERHDLPERYVFYVGGWEDRKNIPFLVRAFAEAGVSDTGLVLAGGDADRQGELTILARSLGIAERVRYLLDVADEELPALYAEALCFVYPSVYEGFGLQLCEAMAAGCPTLASNATSLPEVLGAGGDTFDPTVTKELAQMLYRVARDGRYRAELSARAMRRGHDFSWGRTARTTLGVYEQVIGEQ